MTSQTKEFVDHGLPSLTENPSVKNCYQLLQADMQGVLPHLLIKYEPVEDRLFYARLKVLVLVGELNCLPGLFKI
jgi:hypothetical protein